MRMGAQAAVRRGWVGRHAVRLAGIAIGVCLCLGLAACMSSPSSGQSTPTATATTGASVASSPTATQSGPSPTPLGNGTPSAAQGAADVCMATPGPGTNASLPTNIPAYPNSQLHYGQLGGGNGVFGLCTRDNVDVVANFYVAQLPHDGWQQVTNTTIATSRQLTACMNCSASSGQENLTVTASPDGSIAGETQILIILSGASGA
jgi:hypothetical protein